MKMVSFVRSASPFFGLIAAISLSALIAPGQASAAAIGYSFTISGDTNLPTMRLSNLSTAAKLTSFSLSIGDTAYNFDRVDSSSIPHNSGAPLTFTLLSPDALDAGLRSDAISLTFSGFDPGDVFQFKTDIDKDSINSVEDYRKVLFNNGAAPNAVLSVAFLDGASTRTLSQTLPDGTLKTSYTFSQSVAPVPVPAALPLMASALGALGLVRRKRNA